MAGFYFHLFTASLLLLLLFNPHFSLETSAQSRYEHDRNTESIDYDVDIKLLTRRIRRDAQSEESTNITPSTLNATLEGSGSENVADPLTDSNDSVNQTITHATNGDGLPHLINPSELKNVKLVNHTYYNSTFFGQPEYFEELWENISQMKFKIHPVLSSGHRRAANVTLSFQFPFYGLLLKNVTVCTGGFIYTGEIKHNWLAACQYIAPLMANFNTSIHNDSAVKIADDGSNFTVVWENVSPQEDTNKTFTFAAILRKNGEIIFAYKDVPIPVRQIDDIDHPVKVGVSDAYFQERVIIYKRRRMTMFEYHRISFMDYNIRSGTVLELYNLPTCLQYNTCQDCINHKTSFNCTWCSAVKRCSSGSDRYKNDWTIHNCETNRTTKEAECPLAVNNTVTEKDTVTLEV